MSKLFGHAVAWVICIALGLAATEFYGVFLFFQQQDLLVYKNDRVLAPRPQEASQYRQRIHPYIGFTGPYSLVSSGWNTNNLGFPQDDKVRVPFDLKENDFVVFVFGGSVASNTVISPQGGVTLQAALKELGAFSDRNVVVYSMAQGSEKQPQQVMALATLISMGQRAHVILNVDGYNEFALGYANSNNGINPIFPSLAILSGIASNMEPVSNKTDDFYRIASQLVSARSRAADHASAAGISRTGLSYIYNKLWVSFYSQRRAGAEAEYASGVKASDSFTSIKENMGIDMLPNSKLDQWEEVFQVWLRSTESMKALATSIAAKYVHVIQPNQYFSKKIFSKEEAQIALSMPATDPVRIGAEHGYRMMHERMTMLNAKGVISGIEVFDGEKAPMYFDNCCHYNQRGETIVNRFIASQIEAAVQARSFTEFRSYH